MGKKRRKKWDALKRKIRQALAERGSYRSRPNLQLLILSLMERNQGDVKRKVTGNDTDAAATSHSEYQQVLQGVSS